MYLFKILVIKYNTIIMSVTHYIPQDNLQQDLKPILLLVDARGECFEFLDSLPENKTNQIRTLLVDTLNFHGEEINKFEESLIEILTEVRQRDGKERFFGRKRIGIIHDTLGYCDPTQLNYREGLVACDKVTQILQKFGFDIIANQVPDDRCSLTFKKQVDEFLK